MISFSDMTTANTDTYTGPECGYICYHGNTDAFISDEAPTTTSENADII